MNTPENIDDLARRLSLKMRRECKSLRAVCLEEGLHYAVTWQRLDRAGWRICYRLQKYPR